MWAVAVAALLSTAAPNRRPGTASQEAASPPASASWPGQPGLEVDQAELAVAHVCGLGAAAHLLEAAPVAAVAHSHNHRLGALLQPAPEGADAGLQHSTAGGGRG